MGTKDYDSPFCRGLENKEQTVQEPNTTEAPKQKSRIKIPKKDIVTRTGASRTLIDTSGEKFQNSPGLQHWASVKNLKTAAASYAAADNLSQLQKQIAEKTAEAKSARTELVELEHQMKKVSELLLYAEQYRVVFKLRLCFCIFNLISCLL